MLTTFYIPTRIIFGPGAFRQLGSHAAATGKRALLVTGKNSIRACGLLDRALSILKESGVETVVFDRVEPNPRSTTVDSGARLVKEESLDLVIALGGGSVMDGAKGVVIAAAGGKPIWHYITKEEEPEGKAPGLITVPTVAASGSESNCGAVITNWETHEKCTIGRNCAYPAVSIVDPELTLTLPLKPTLQGGVDIFCHLLERYITAENPAPLTDGIIETALKLVVTFLPRASADLNDIESRTQLSWASTIACSDFISLGGGDGALTLHGIEHAVSGFYDIAHGDGLAALLPAWMEYTYPVRHKRFARLGENVFGHNDGIGAVRQWLVQIGMGLKLRDFDIEDARIPAMAECAVKTAPWLVKHPLPLEADTVAALYRQSW
ncbi:MAG: iron-containing alcohol dehydrogenase [Dehalococcoidaceae bacterium]|nr:iron-containing alcohol dehydrogenase [Dehalococcoidaceae bacterium]